MARGGELRTRARLQPGSRTRMPRTAELEARSRAAQVAPLLFAETRRGLNSEDDGGGCAGDAALEDAEALARAKASPST